MKGFAEIMTRQGKRRARRRIGVAIGALLLAGGLSLPAAAQAPGARTPGRTIVPERIDPALRFTVRERDLFRSWYAGEYGRGNCAPGLKKKTTDCFAPGRTDKRYTIGTRLPAAITIAPLPLDLARRIGSPPIGYRYAIVDGDLLKLAVDTLLVIDAISGLAPP